VLHAHTLSRDTMFLSFHILVWFSRSNCTVRIDLWILVSVADPNIWKPFDIFMYIMFLVGSRNYRKGPIVFWPDDIKGV